MESHTSLYSAVPILSHMNAIHTQPHSDPIPIMIHFNIIIPSTNKPRPSERSFFFTLSSQIFVRISYLSHVRYVPHTSHSPLLYHYNIIWRILDIFEIVSICKNNARLDAVWNINVMKLHLH